MHRNKLILTSESQAENLTSGQSQAMMRLSFIKPVLSKSCCMSSEASRRDKHSETMCKAVSLAVLDTYIANNVFVAFNDAK